MNKILFLLVLLCCYGCSESTTEMNENTGQQLYNSIKGTYSGNVLVNNIPQKIYVTISNDLTVKYLPVRPILEHIFTGASLDEAVVSAGNVVFDMPIDQMLVMDGNAYLILEPTDLMFSVTADGKSFSVVALVEGSVYVNRASSELSMNLDVTKLYCEGICYDKVNYYLDNARKEE